ncbi:hypothetical protein V3C99_018376 [Haemonchus contortus]
MAEIQLFKTRITHACRLIRSSESDLKLLDNPFTFPTEKEECEVYIREKTAQLNHLTTTITKAKQLHDTYVDKAIETISSRSEQKDREKLMLELNNHMELESNGFEIAMIQWLSKIEFRKEELAQQASFIAEATSIANQAGSSQHNSHSGGDTLSTLYERTIRVRRPLLEVPTFSGDYREFNTFWSVFESLIHNEKDLSDQEKFLFLKQALEGKAAASISSIPVIGDKYNVALNILKKQYDRSSGIADILINEIEHLPRAQENSRSCRNTFNSISSRIVHLEQTGVPMNADRVWRRLILSKFTENICSQVIKKENQSGTGFEVKDILDAVDEIITLQETTELTTKTLFGTQTAQAMQNNARGHNGGRNQMKQFPSHRLRHTCLCGESHSPQQCARFPTPETRRMEAKRQGVCWKCFDKTHGSRFCTAMGPCPKCKGDHHGSLCITSSSGLESMILPNRRQNPPPNSTQHGAARMPLPSQTNRFRQPTPRNNNSRETNRVQTLHAAPARNFTTESQRPVSGQCVLQMASALIFNEASGDYQPITILLDSGAQKSFIKAEMRNRLRLPTISSTSFTTTGMGELQETFKSNEVKVTLKGLRSSRKLQRLSVFTKEKLTSTTKTALLSEADKSFIKREKIMIAQQTLRPSELSPDLLIGQDLLNQVIEHHNPVIKLPSGLVLTPTVFGYTISGASSTLLPNNGNSDTQCTSLIVATPVTLTNDSYKKDIKHLYELESLGINTQNDIDEAAVIKFMDNYRKTIVIDNGNITAGFPFTEEVRNLKDNFSVALRRLQNLLRTLHGDEEKLKLYSGTFASYLQEGIIEEATDQPDRIATFYLPHRHVWTPSKSTLPRSSKIIIFSIVMIHLIAIGETCQYTHTLNANNTVCSRSSYKTDCFDVQESTITLSQKRPQACFRLRNRNQTVGSMEVQLQHVFITCNPVVLFYTRDVNIVTVSVKRCHLAGSCSSQKCAHISSRSEIPELHDTYEFPGIARCTTSCGGIGCGCLLPTPGCLFSRSYAKPKNDKIYQVFHCPTWQESALITFTYTGIKGGKRSEMITVDTQTTHAMKDANITLEFITMPVIPLLGTVFLGSVDSNHSEVAIIEEEDFFALRCSNLKSASNISECYVEDRCSCSPSETEAKCDCKNLDVNAKMTSTESRLPISSSVLHLQDDHGRVLGAMHSAVVDLTLST